MNNMNNNDPSNIITLRSVYGKVKTYYFNPMRGKNGTYPPFVKRVRVSADGRDTEMILSEQELNSDQRDFFIPEDLEIIVTDGTTFDLSNQYQKNIWECIKDSHLIAPERGAKDEHGNLLIDGDIRRYGLAELYVERPGVESKKRVSRIKLVTKAYTFIEQDTSEHRKVICKLLGKSMRNAPDTDIQDYLYQKAEKDPNLIIDIYTSADQALKLLLIDGKQKNIIRTQSGVLMYSDTALGVTDEAAILFLKDPKNKAIYDSIVYEVFGDMKTDDLETKPRESKKK
jgi:hypothetical protein|nr:MAG TPA: hypothetical protein [Bacteriophage sp.]DAI39986.1 MAG TPA: hypothetical protein [Caudoviricetes sp.]